MNADDLVRTPEGGWITSVEAFVLGVMAAIIVAVGIPSYLSMRDRANDSAAREHARRAAAAVEEYRIVNGSLSGITPRALRRLDAGLDASSYRLRVTGRSSYCVESSVGGRPWHFVGSAGSVAHGSCP